MGAPSLGPGVGGAAVHRPSRFWLRWSSWHWTPRRQISLSVCFFLHFAIAFEEVTAHFSLAGLIHVAVGTVTVAADPLQNAETHRHLLLGHMVRERAAPICLLACASDKSGAHGHLLRVMDIGAALDTVTPAKAVVIHAVLSPLLFCFACRMMARLRWTARLAKERLQLVAGSIRPGRRRALLPSLGRLEVLESLLADTL